MTNRIIRQQQREATQRWKDSPKPKHRLLHPRGVPHVIQRNGGRERVRRKAQIERGQLRAENGLATV